MEGWALLLVFDCLGWPLGLCMGDICKTWKAAVRLRIAALAESRYVPVRALEPYAALFEFWTKCGLGDALRHRTASTEHDQAPGLRIAASLSSTSSATGGRRADAHRLSRQIRRPIWRRFRRGYTMALSARQRCGVAHGASTEGAKSHATRYIGRRHDKNRAANSDMRVLWSCNAFFEAGAASREIPRLGNM